MVGSMVGQMARIMAGSMGDVVVKKMGQIAQRMSGLTKKESGPPSGLVSRSAVCRVAFLMTPSYPAATFATLKRSAGIGT